MSVTFDVNTPRNRTEIPACPNCGATAVNPGDLDCQYTPDSSSPFEPYPCDGFGLLPRETGINVANASAALILFDLLGYGRSEVDAYAGELDPSDVLRRLATAEHKIASLTSPVRESRGVYVDENGVGEGCLVIEAGYDSDRISRYVSSLRELATKAQEHGTKIVYG